ncbi:histidine phosphatase family protein [Companilactobacillus zhongbaensis]|uniref:histidine phosphatase family protein n=1 Tax=Companilactobacillus zhongbaensis TaxID=2486009 RepID=UPI000F7ADB68|nr:histidine phosphatase family protein [Companilactobacillus zhongbaensis]
MKLIVARHGETAWNLQKKFYGTSDVLLDEKGLQQAQDLAQAITNHRLTFDVAYCSGLKRTYQTIKPALKKDVPLFQLPGLNEKGFGKWEGMDANEIEAAYPEEWQKWLDQPFDYVPPEAEDYYVFRQHVQASLANILQTALAKKQENILLVAHLGTLRVIEQTLLKSDEVFWDIHFDAGCFSEYTSNDGKNFELIKRNVGR